MQEATFLILTALAGGSQHGYGIISDVRADLEAAVKLRAGTLYTALDRLREEEAHRRGARRGRGQPAASLLPAHAHGRGEAGRGGAARLQANARIAMLRLDPSEGMAST
jgi:hypothetical protein